MPVSYVLPRPSRSRRERAGGVYTTPHLRHRRDRRPSQAPAEEGRAAATAPGPKRAAPKAKSRPDLRHGPGHRDVRPRNLGESQHTAVHPGAPLRRRRARSFEGRSLDRRRHGQGRGDGRLRDEVRRVQGRVPPPGQKAASLVEGRATQAPRRAKKRAAPRKGQGRVRVESEHEEDEEEEDDDDAEEVAPQPKKRGAPRARAPVVDEPRRRRRRPGPRPRGARGGRRGTRPAAEEPAAGGGGPAAAMEEEPAAPPRRSPPRRPRRFGAGGGRDGRGRRGEFGESPSTTTAPRCGGAGGDRWRRSRRWVPCNAAS